MTNFALHSTASFAAGESSNADAILQNIRQVIGSLLYGGREIHLHLNDGTDRVATAHYDDDRDAIVTALPHPEAAKIVSLTLNSYNSAYTFSTAGLAGKDDPAVFALPKAFTQQQRRTKMRALAPTTWRVRYLDGDGLTVERCLSNISVDGIGMVSQPQDEASFSAQVMTAIAVYDGPTKISNLLAELCNVTYDRSVENSMIFGLRVRALSLATWQTWETAVNHILHPNTRDGRQSSHEVWNLFTHSGYFNLSNKQPEQFAAQKVAHEQFNLVLDENPGLGTHTLWQGKNGVEASISCCMPYAHTALLHQMAKISGTEQNRVVLRDMLIHSFEYMKHQPTLQWVAAFLNKKVAFNDFAFLDFAKPYLARKQACILPFYLIEVTCDSPCPMPFGLHVAEAAAADYAQISQQIILSRGSIYAEAFDLTHSRLGAQTAQVRWGRVGIDRERKVVLVRDATGTNLAAGVMDISPEGSNMFGVFDALTLVNLQGTGPLDPQALAALLHVTRKWYTRAGKNKFIWHDLDQISATCLPAGTIDLGVGTLWIIARELIGDLQEYWYTRMMRPRGPRKTA